ncbi:pilus assembly protein [Pyxidicoccus xibeiensis]|uniref:pilus assembly protein PilY n=1 Tax=Pyxidicoccus xibeiensis TaxID=2906759 RepID=UPI0020A70BC4|nr:pilus assembly protein PilY [Pyxidicoccus xibeiensis]MCP3144155.1 pilus assembly protein PilY [Pyxidicoccus xibeiensis]
MRLRSILITAALFAAPGAALAQAGDADAGVTFNPCIDTTGQDRQPDFNADAGAYSSVMLTNDTPPKLRLNTNQTILDPERIILPFEQEVEALIVDEQAGAGASHTLGWFYYQDLIDKQYVNVNDPGNPNDDTLVDADDSGVPDFHEDLFNINPRRPYIGLNPRCDRRFTLPKPDGTLIEMREPDLLTSSCASPRTYSPTMGPKRWPEDDLGYPARPASPVVGQTVAGAGLNVYNTRTAYTNTDTWFSDQGLFPHIPNLLEPSDWRNGHKGLGNIAFYATDDDENHCNQPSQTSECLQPRMAWSADGTTPVNVWDKSGNRDGIPDYKASAFDTKGRVRPGTNPAAAPNEEDRRVKLGMIQGGKEVVFFLVTYVEQIYGRQVPFRDENGNIYYQDGQPVMIPQNSTDSCFMTKTMPDGRQQCHFWAHGDINVFFSKTLLNMDLHQTGASDGNLVVTKNLRTNWLGYDAYDRLDNPEYGRVFFEQDQMKDVYAYNQRAAHTIVGAPIGNERVWILGWEDQNSGGDRTYNDIVILINKQNNGVFKSDVVSSDISPSVARDYTITSVTLSIDDEPYFEPVASTQACTPEVEQPDGSIHRPLPSITYQVALDCKVCVSGCDGTTPVFEPKRTEPEWVTVPFQDPGPDPGTRNRTVSVDDLLERGYTGTQLCWRAILQSPGEGCQPTIANVNVSYKAQKAGQYGRSGRIGVANTLLYGAGEVPGRNWAETPHLNPSQRLLDGRPDMSPRGHVYLKKLYEPENPAVTLSSSNTANPPVWDAGEVQRVSIRSSDPFARKLFTRRLGTRTELKSITGDTHPIFPTAPGNELCAYDGVRYDLNDDGECNSTDRTVLRDWLYGWEKYDAAAPADSVRSPRRTWPMGTINLSTPAMVGPPVEPAWLSNPTVSETEKTNFRARFRDNALISGRKNVAFIGTGQGFLHALDVGKLTLEDDMCTPATEYTGYFDHTSGCTAARSYGTGAELFAYLPGKMLPYYVENYLRAERAGRPGATMDASPAVGPVDLGQNSSADTTGTNDYNARRGYTPASTTAWQLNTNPTSNTGAKTVLASATGPKQSVFFALDVTNPASTNTNYPWPMWEYDVANELYHGFDNAFAPCTTRSDHWDCVTLSEIFDYVHGRGEAVVRADTSGSRHNPLLLRMDFGSRGGKKWVAAFATDFVPRPGTAGTLYLIDVKTGQPIQVNHGSGLKQRLAGIVTLGTDPAQDHDQGIGGSPAAVDVDGDGNQDVLYVPSTSGKVYKVNLRDVNADRDFGKALSSCVIANARTATYANGSTVEHPDSQRIYADMMVRTTRSGSSATVDLFFGTANNPDTDLDADDRAASPRRYHVMAFRDTAPLATDCSGRTQVWVHPLGLGQAVWGGLSIVEGAVSTATAVGTKADVCSVDADTSGKLYSLSQATGDGLVGSGADLGGHSLSTPVSYDRHLILPITTAGTTQIVGNTAWQNPKGDTGGTRSRVLIWDVRPGGNIREVIP